MSYCEDCDKHMHITDYERHIPCKGRKRKDKPSNKKDTNKLEKSIEKTIYRAIMKTWHTANRKDENTRAAAIVAARDVSAIFGGVDDMAIDNIRAMHEAMEPVLGNKLRNKYTDHSEDNLDMVPTKPSKTRNHALNSSRQRTRAKQN